MKGTHSPDDAIMMMMMRGVGSVLPPTSPVPGRRTRAPAWRWPSITSHNGRSRAFRDPVGAVPLGTEGIAVSLPWGVAPRDVAATAVSLVGSLVVVKWFDAMAARGLVERTLSRKLIHITCGPCFVATWVFFTAAPSARLLAALVPLAQGARLLFIGSGRWRDVAAVQAVSRGGGKEELLQGPFFYTIVLAGLTLAFWRSTPVGLIAAAVMCGGDGMAGVVGRRLGASNPLPAPLCRTKSWAGSAAMLLGSLAVSALLIEWFAGHGCLSASDVSAGDGAPGLAWGAVRGEVYAKAAVVSAVAALVECLPISDRVDDNVSVPLAATLLGWCLFA